MTYCVIPVAEGSERVVGKNLAFVGDEPLLQRAIRVARQADLEPVVLTDSPLYASIGRIMGAKVINQPEGLPSRVHTLDEVYAAAAEEHPWLMSFVAYQATVVVEPADLKEFAQQDFTEPTALACPNRHLVWQQGIPPERVKGQDSVSYREVGIRWYPQGKVGAPTEIYPVNSDIVDIDYPADLLVVQPPKHVVFRVKASERVGSGHIRRCLAIAEQLQHHDVSFWFVESAQWAKDLVPDRWRANDRMPDVIVNDTLDTTRGEVSGLGIPWIALEDHGEDAHYADAVINALYGGPHEGGAWADIRPEFYAVPEWSPEGGILVAFGGTDPHHLTEQVAAALADHGDVRIVAPPGRTVDVPGLIHDASIAEEIARARLVVCSGGRTVHEALFCERPVMVVCQNPREMTHTHLDYGSGVVNCGLAGVGGVDRLLEALEDLDGQMLWELHQHTVGKVDGGGIRRIARLVEALLT